MAFPIVFFTVLGAIIGSFLNVVVIRYGTGLSLSGRSACLSCGQTLRFYELIPIVSYIALWGRCLRCQSRILLQYPLVEAFSALLFGSVAYTLQPNSPISFLYAFFVCGILSVLIAIGAYDVRHKIIPEKLAILFITLSFFTAVYRFIGIEMESSFYLNILAGPMLFLPFFLLWYLSKGKLMGLGDGKLALGIGWFLGFSYGLSAIIIGFWIGAIFGLYLIGHSRLFLKSGGLTMKSEIPFAPFLIIGTIIVFFFHINLFALGAAF